MLDLEWLAALWQRHQEEFDTEISPLSVGSEGLRIGAEPRLMGVVNLSPQSWYRESVCLSPEAAIQRAKLLHTQGADVIDIGGESTLGHAERVSPEDQIKMLRSIVATLVGEGLTLSVETYSATVAAAVLQEGAQIINMTGTSECERIYQLAAEANAAVIASYVQGPHVREVESLTFSGDPYRAFHEYFKREIDRAAQWGQEKVILDPGLGFYYKNLSDGNARVRYQMETFVQSFRLNSLGKPICHALPHAFEFFGEEVRTAESFFAVLAAIGKTHLLRTHEIPRVKAVIDTLQCFTSSSPAR